MKTPKLVASVLLATAVGVSSVAHSQHSHSHAHKPLHGGIVVEASDVDFELVAKPDVLTLYVRDHGTPLDMKGASGKLVLLVGTEKIEAALAPIEGGALQAKGAFKLASGTKAVLTVVLPGRKPITARFVMK